MYIKVKRLCDFIFSLIGLIILAPLSLIIVLAIKIDSQGPVFFKQKRLGINKKYFNILKFRTMKVDTPKNTPTHLLENPEIWITRVGKFLRKTSLDELPQLINILKGEMSIVGPRPALWNQADLISLREDFGINDILPGLTGWAQVNGRDDLSVVEKVKLDHEYLENLSFKMDLKCFLKTFANIFKGTGVVEGKVIVEKDNSQELTSD